MQLIPPANFNPNRPSADDLEWAYRHGIFPMGDATTGEVDWFAPDPRGIIPLDTFHVPKNLSRLVQQQKFIIRINTAFREVMQLCSRPRSRENATWITPEIIDAYVVLYQRRKAHSVEAWLDDQLVGGLYGVAIGSAFFGESMFSRPELGGSNASKVCLVELVDRLNSCEFTLLDTQFWNPHLDQFGCIEIAREEYLKRLQIAVAAEREFE